VLGSFAWNRNTIFGLTLLPAPAPLPTSVDGASVFFVDGGSMEGGDRTVVGVFCALWAVAITAGVGTHVGNLA
jgi:hypothetical protein